MPFDVPDSKSVKFFSYPLHYASMALRFARVFRFLSLNGRTFGKQNSQGAGQGVIESSYLGLGSLEFT
jgi:hypothetical protein